MSNESDYIQKYKDELRWYGFSEKEIRTLVKRDHGRDNRIKLKEFEFIELIVDDDTEYAIILKSEWTSTNELMALYAHLVKWWDAIQLLIDNPQAEESLVPPGKTLTASGSAVVCFTFDEAYKMLLDGENYTMQEVDALFLFLRKNENLLKKLHERNILNGHG